MRTYKHLPCLAPSSKKGFDTLKNPRPSSIARSSKRHAGVWAAAAIAFLVVPLGCAGPTPAVQLLGISSSEPVSPTEVLLFVEVTNPTQRDLTLSRFDYELETDGLLTDKGRVPLTRELSAGATAVVEIPVRGVKKEAAGVALQLRGRLHATEDRVPRSWPFASKSSVEREVEVPGSITVKTVPLFSSPE